MILIESKSKWKKGNIIFKEEFCISKNENNIPVGNIKIPENSILAGNIKVSVLRCNPIINRKKQKLCVGLLFLIEEKLKIIQPSGRELPLEFIYRLKKNLPLKYQNEILSGDVKHINCRAVILSVNNNLTLNPSDPGKTNGSIDENIDIYIKVKVLKE